MDQNQIDASPSDARTGATRSLVYGATHKTRFLTRPNCLLQCPRFNSPPAPSMGALRSRTTGKPKWQSRPSKMDVLSREPFWLPPIPSGPFGRSPIADIKLALHPKGVPQWMDVGEGNRSAHLPSFRNQGATLIYDLSLPHPCAASQFPSDVMPTDEPTERFIRPSSASII